MHCQATDIFQTLIPRPLTIIPLEGIFELRADATIRTEPNCQDQAAFISGELAGSTGFPFPLGEPSSAKPGDIFLRIAPEITGNNPESYHLTVQKTGVIIHASTRHGLIHGFQTLRQLLPPCIYDRNVRDGLVWQAPCVRIEDSPEFCWRGIMLDSARHFQPLKVIYRWIDLMSQHKLNRFHWHLTDDQGWRVEIKQYPLLTQVGSIRAGTLRGHALDRPDGEHDNIPHQGYYSQQDITSVVSYADQRGIQVIPEIEMPGHMQAAVAAYPDLGSLPDSNPGVATRWGLNKNLFNVRPETLTFLENTLVEIFDLFPSPYIHLGGDEANKATWKKNVEVQQRIQQLQLRDETDLYNWFMKRFCDFARLHNKHPIGWDEILEGGDLSPETIIMCWHNGSHVSDSLRRGQPTILAPSSHTYFDHYQSEDRMAEPLAIGGKLTLEDVYKFDPRSAPESEADYVRILGIQAQLWTEYIPNPAHLEYMALPRMCALAEVAWRKASGQFQNFARGLTTHLKRLDCQAYRYRPEFREEKAPNRREGPAQKGKHHSNLSRNPTGKQPTGQEGFAVIIALSMMSFIVLLLVSLVTLSRVEIVRSNQLSAESLARENARLGLYTALGNLQKHAGRDQVITVKADLFDSSQIEIPSIPPGHVDLSGNDEKGHWTGVVQTSITGLDANFRNAIQWLVSGEPAGMDALTTPPSQSASKWNLEGESGTEVVKVPWVDIHSGKTEKPGSYAYWISDEGVKARMNLSDPNLYSDTRPTTGDANGAIFHRPGIENVTGLAELKTLLQDPDSGPEVLKLLQRMNGHEELAMLIPSLNESLKSSHLTGYSQGVLTSTTTGGLRNDLTAHLQSSKAWTRQDFIIPEDMEDFEALPEDLANTEFLRDRRGPSWALLQDFANLHLLHDGDAIKPRIDQEAIPPEQGRATPIYGTSVSLTPVPVYIGLNFGLRAVQENVQTLTLGASGPAPQDVERHSYRLFLVVEPIVVLWNPYDIALKPCDYLVEFSFRNGLWGAQPALTLYNSSLVSFWEDEVNSLVGGLNKDFVPSSGGSPDWTQFLEEWNFHLHELMPTFGHNSLHEFDTFGRHRQERNYASARNGGAWPHNPHFAIEQASFEPGEFITYSAENVDQVYDPDGKILKQGLHFGSFLFPIGDSSQAIGWKSLSASGTVGPGDNPSAYGNYRFLPADDLGIDPGRIVLDFPLSSGPHALPSSATVGLGHRGGQYAVQLRMLDAAEANPIQDYLDEPFGNDDRDRANSKWKTISYVNLQQGRNVPPSTITFNGNNNWEQYLISTGVALMSPNRDQYNVAAPAGVGIKGIAVANMRSRSNGWDFVKSPPSGRLGYMDTGPATYAFRTRLAPSLAYAPSDNWDSSALADPSDPYSQRVVLFHVPRTELFSLGQFRHLEMGKTGWEPSYVFGNSLASPWIPPNRLSQDLVNWTIHDRSFFMNKALWDDYFLSTWDPSSEIIPDNPRMNVMSSPDSSVGASEIAGNLLCKGAFNINSTSPEAWRAVLSGGNLRTIDYIDVVNGRETSSNISNAFYRTPKLSGGEAVQPGSTGFPNSGGNYWRGFRELSERQISELSNEIVALIRKFGPFPSLAAFINRRPGSNSDPLSARGIIDLAIKRQSETSREPINANNGPVVQPSELMAAHGAGRANNIAFEEPLLGPRREGAPGFLTQADVLTPLGPFLNARSDTFVVHFEGRVTEPNSTEVVARARGEAVVQRVPTYVDTDNPPSSSVDALSPTNQAMGRRFRLVSFKWTTP